MKIMGNAQWNFSIDSFVLIKIVCMIKLVGYRAMSRTDGLRLTWKRGPPRPGSALPVPRGTTVI